MDMWQVVLLLRGRVMVSQVSHPRALPVPQLLAFVDSHLSVLVSSLPSHCSTVLTLTGLSSFLPSFFPSSLPPSLPSFLFLNVYGF